jgi:FAD/FMN-containing dehydrogenase
VGHGINEGDLDRASGTVALIIVGAVGDITRPDNTLWRLAHLLALHHRVIHIVPPSLGTAPSVFIYQRQCLSRSIPTRLHRKDCMTAYQFHVGGLTSDNHSGACLVLHTTSTNNELWVRLALADVQDLAITLAGASSAPVRLARLISQLAQQFDATLSHVQLWRGVGQLIEAALVLKIAHESCSFPVTFGDGMTLAIAHHLPIHGDESLVPLLKLAATADVPLPAALTAFLNTLSEE